MGMYKVMAEYMSVLKGRINHSFLLSQSLLLLLRDLLLSFFTFLLFHLVFPL
jgi:hypothetical protein